MAEKTTALTMLNQTKTSVIAKLEDYMTKGQIDMPKSYSYGNALNQAQLMLQDNEAAMACSHISIAKAMLDMAIEGLNPKKDQCYFVAYKGQLKMQSSYLGKIAILKRIDPTVKDVFGKAVKKGEVFEYEDDLLTGFHKVTKHKTTLESMDSKDIVAAYATVVYNDGKEPISLVMTIDRVKKAWQQSPMRPLDDKGNIRPGTTHDKFPDEMAGKVPVTKICNHFIRQSDDESLFMQTVLANEIENTAAMAQAEVDINANTGDVIDIPADWEEEPTEAEQPVENSVETVDNTEDLPKQDTLFE